MEQKQVYHSMDELPPDVRARVEELRDAGGIGTSQTITFRDSSGNEQTYHSPDEMPPEIREIYEKARQNTDR